MEKIVADEEASPSPAAPLSETTVPVETTNDVDIITPPPPNQQHKDEEETIFSTNNNNNKVVKELRTLTTPERLKLPKAFRYPERYRSPTDMMVSPITKGILARTRRPGLLPPTTKQDQLIKFKIQESMAIQEVGALFP